MNPTKNTLPDDDFPQPETVLAIRGAIALGRQGGPQPPDGSRLAEFWGIGHLARNASDAMHEAIEPFKRLVGDATVHLQDQVNALKRAASAIDGIYPARFEDEPLPANNHG